MIAITLICIIVSTTFLGNIAAFYRYENRWSVKWGKSPSYLENVELRDFENIAGMFPDCTLYILSPGVHVVNVASVPQPRVYYSDVTKYAWDYFTVPGSGRPLWYQRESGDLKYYQVARKTVCKAEFAIDFNWSKREMTKEIRLQDFFTLEPHYDSNFVYQILITSRKEESWPSSMLYWNLSTEASVKMPRRLFANRFRSRVWNQLMFLYQFKYLRTQRSSRWRALRKNQEIIAENRPIKSYNIAGMEYSCVACRYGGIVSDTWVGQEAVDKLREVGQRAKTCGTALAHESEFSHVINFSIVTILSIAIETGGGFDAARDQAREDAFTSVKMEGGSERLMLARGRIQPVLPEHIMVRSLQLKHANMTFFSIGDTYRLDITYPGTELIYGPGSLDFGVGWESSSIPAAQAILRLVTCSNVRKVPVRELSHNPFDSVTWGLLSASLWCVATAAFLTLPRSQRSTINSLPTAFLLVATILVNSLQDMRRSVRRRPVALGILIVVTACCGIAMTFVYRAASLSGLLAPPTITGAEDFREVVADGQWTFMPFVGSHIVKLSKTFYNSIFMIQPLWILVATLEEYDNATDNYWNDRAYTTMFLSANQSRKLYRETGNIPCSCNRTAFIVLETSVTDVSLPDSCIEKMGSTNFVVDSNYIFRETLGWSSTWARDGRFFRSLKRFLESGIYSYLNHLLRHMRNGLVLSNGIVKRAGSQEFSVMALSMRTFVIWSAFSIWGVMILVGVTLFVVEMAMNLTWTNLYARIILNVHGCRLRFSSCYKVLRPRLRLVADWVLEVLYYEENAK